MKYTKTILQIVLHVETVWRRSIVMAIVFSGVSFCLMGQTESSEIKRDKLVNYINENDAFKFKNGTDKYYSFGVFLNYQKQLSEQDNFINYIQGNGKNDTKYFVGVEMYLKGFTPEHNSDILLTNARPFAGILALQTQLSSVNNKRYLRIAVETGVRGPASGAEQVQNEWHKFAGKPLFPGWKHQLPNQFLFNGYGALSIPFTLTRHVEFLAESTVALGNHNTYLQQGLLLRIGIFNSIKESSLFNAHGSQNHSRKEIFLTSRIFYRAVMGDATLSESDSRNIGLMQLDRDDHIGGIDLKLYYQSNRYGLQLGYSKRSSDSNFTVRHSYGTIGISVLI